MHYSGLYHECAFETVGMGVFTPLAGANPTIGSVGAPVYVAETRVEILCVRREVAVKGGGGAEESLPV